MLKSVFARLRTHALTLFLVAGVAVSGAAAQDGPTPSDPASAQFGTPPTSPSGAFPPELASAVQIAFVDSLETRTWGPEQSEALALITQSGDPRIGWIVSDMMRFTANRALFNDLMDAASGLLDTEFGQRATWGSMTDHLIAWDIPAPPDYLDYKRRIFLRQEPGWDFIFTEGDVDWRHVSWGGVLIDDRPYDRTDASCNCIPAADNPEVSTAAEATWLADDAIVFGLEINGEARAYPRRIMEVREMVNDTLGGRDIGMPYCTLCGAAQAYYTDGLPDGIDRPILRTSGLLIRSNKVMYDITSGSVFDTFRGRAVTGPLADRGLTLEQAPVITATWGDWKAAHPDTTVLVEALALGRDFDFRNTRDAAGPIFPVGLVDPRLPVHEDIIGVITPSGTPVAFPRATAMVALSQGRDVGFETVTLILDAGGIRAVDSDGGALGSHQAFWFAWSQFHPETELWAG